MRRAMKCAPGARQDYAAVLTVGRGKSYPRSVAIFGTSGWSYGSWRGPFFPHDLPEQGWLEFYARQFRTTELNGVFYRTPTAEAIRGCEERTPEGFLFAWKAARFALGTIERYLAQQSRAAGRPSTSAWQKSRPGSVSTSPTIRKDRARLASFLRLLSTQR